MKIQRTQNDSKAFKSNILGTVRNPKGFEFNRELLIIRLANEAEKRELIKAQNLIQKRFLTRAKSLISMILYDVKVSPSEKAKVISGELAANNAIIWDS